MVHSSNTDPVRRDLEAVPRVRPGLDVTAAGLSVDEYFLLSRIDGHTTVRDLIHICGWGEDRTFRLLDRLTQVGVILWGDQSVDSGPRPDTVVGEKPDYGNFVFPPGFMEEEGRLSREARKKIIWFHYHLDEWTHYDLLQIPRRATEDEIKKSFRLRSKEWHPDRYHVAKDMPSFKTMLDQIFKRVQIAKDVLLNVERRREYDFEHSADIDEAEIAAELRAIKRKEREERYQRERVERRKKKNPMRGALRRARGLYQEAQDARKNGDILKALSLAQLAKAYDDPLSLAREGADSSAERSSLAELVDELTVEAAELRAAPMVRRAQNLELKACYDDAVDLLEEAVRIAPSYGPAHVRLAYNLVRLNRDPEQAVFHAQKGVHFCPDDPEAHYTLALAYRATGKNQPALKAVAKAIDLKPNFKEAKKLQRELRWGF